jgi:regulator of CtrA degradation
VGVDIGRSGIAGNHIPDLLPYKPEALLRGGAGLLASRQLENRSAVILLPEADEEHLRGLTLQSFTASALFERTFDEGMALVEETSRYLDGRGRQESHDLPRKIALLYAGESMRVTTRLMQAASWLLIQRAVHEGEMDAEDAASERYRLGSKDICMGGSTENLGELPKKLQDLLDRSSHLYRRIARLDDALFGQPKPQGVQAHFNRLQENFGGLGGDAGQVSS